MIRRGLASSFDIREHLSTKAPYAHRVRIPGAPSLHELPDPPAGHQLSCVWALTRHGSRWPTDKRLQQMSSLQHVFKAADASRHPWMIDWAAPMAGFEWLAGELHAMGEAEMSDLAERLRRRFPQLSSQPYCPRRFPIIATQVPRTSQSASAFALSFFTRHGDTSASNGPQQQQHGSTATHEAAGGGCRSLLRCCAVALNMLPKREDPVLRPFDSCPAYVEHEDRAMRWLAPWMQQHWRSMAPDLEQRLGLPPRSLTACHVDALWQLCAFEAGLGSTTNPSSSSASSTSNGTKSVCDLFSREQVLLLEWLEDVRLYEVQGYGAPINFEIAAPLLADAASALVSAAAVASAGRVPLQLARLHFAHAETLAPLAALLGLFRPAEASAEAQHMPRLPGEAALRTLTAGAHSTRVKADWAAVDSSADDLLPLIMAAEDEAADSSATAAVASSTAAAESEAGSAGDGVSAADVQSGGQWDFTGVSEHVPLAAAGAADASGPGQREQQQQHQQRRSAATSHSRQREAAASQLRKRRRLAASPPGSTAGAAATAAAAADGGLDDMAVAAAEAAAARGSSRASDEAERSMAGQLQDNSSSSSFSSSSSSSSDVLDGNISSSSSSNTKSLSMPKSKHSHRPALEGCSYKGRPLDPGLLLPPPPGWAPRPALDDGDRAWRGGRVAPLGANLLLVLYTRNSSSSRSADKGQHRWLEDHLVRLVYNEQVLAVPGCRPAAGGTGFEVTLAEFLRVAVGSKTDGRRFRKHCGDGGGGGGNGGGLELLTADGLSIVLPDWGDAGDDSSDGNGGMRDLFRLWY